jgi:phosphohistidine phosphatase
MWQELMKLYVIRHAKAVDREEGIPDSSRFLTPDGRSSFRDTVCGAGRKLNQLDIILSSPLVRAVQTADILAEAVRFNGPVEMSTLLSPGCDARSLLLLLQQQADRRRVAVVGHEPDLSSVVATLCGLNRPFRFKKGGIIALRLDLQAQTPQATFKWMADGGPKAIRTLEELYERYAE